jgi:cytochrome c5
MKAHQFLPFVIVAVLAGCGEKTAAPTAAPAEPTASAPAPAPAPSVAAPAETVAEAIDTGPVIAAASAGDLARGKQVYNTSCIACHAAAVMGAPKLSDKAAWDPRLAKGLDALYASSISGIKLMPPRGGNASLKDEDLKAAVDFMVTEIK